jgi:hypothetical protein
MKRTCEEEGCKEVRSFRSGDSVTCVDSLDSTRSCLHVDLVPDRGSKHKTERERETEKKERREDFQFELQME